MKKFLVTGVYVCLIILLVGCTVKESSNNNQVNSSNNKQQNTNSEQVDKQTTLSLKDIVGVYSNVYPNTTISEIKFENGNYEVDGLDNNNEYKVLFNSSKSVISSNSKELDFTEKNGVELKLKGFSIDNLLEIDKAIEIAKNKVNGTIKEWTLEKEATVVRYDIEFTTEQKVIIDAVSGNVHSF